MSKASWFLVILFPLVLTGWLSHSTPSVPKGPIHAGESYLAQNVAAPTPTPTASSSPTETVPPRVLPNVGTNAVLVIGASILVLIIIGGVVFSSRKGKH